MMILMLYAIKIKNGIGYVALTNAIFEWNIPVLKFFSCPSFHMDFANFFSSNSVNSIWRTSLRFLSKTSFKMSCRIQYDMNSFGIVSTVYIKYPGLAF